MIFAGIRFEFLLSPNDMYIPLLLLQSIVTCTLSLSLSLC